MTINQAKKIAREAGYDIREGSYIGTTDDRLGTWYVTHESDNGFRPYGAGHATKTAAWQAAAWQAERDAAERVFAMFVKRFAL